MGGVPLPGAKAGDPWTAGVVLGVRLWWGDGCCSGFAGRYSRYFALRLAARFAGPGGYMAGHPSKRPLLWTCTGGRSMLKNIEDIPYLQPAPESHGSPGLCLFLPNKKYI